MMDYDAGLDVEERFHLVVLIGAALWLTAAFLEWGLDGALYGCALCGLGVALYLMGEFRRALRRTPTEARYFTFD